MLPEINKIKYSFVIGIGRSGTTLLSKLLNQHRNCLVSLEIEFVIFFRHSFRLKKEFGEKEYKLIVMFFDSYCKRHPALKIILDTDMLYNELLASGIKDYSALTKFLHLRFNFYNKPLDEIKLIVDKNPSYTLHVEKLLRFAPESKFIFMIRDYRANILSRKQSIEFRSPDTAFNAYRWNFYNRKAFRELRKRGGIITLLKYEDLVESSEIKLSDLFLFLGLTDQMPEREYYKDKPFSDDIDIEQIKKIRPRYTKTLGDVEKNIYNGRVNAWVHELSERDLKICEVICGDLGECAGYKKVLKISFSERLLIRISTFPQYIKAAIDYYKEYLIYYASPSLKLWRIKNKNFVAPKSSN